MSGNNKKLIAFNYFGGKFSWLEHLYENFPNEFIHLADLFGGSFSVTLNYEGNVIKTANEINSNITNFFEVLRDNEEELIKLIQLTPCSKEEYNRCWEYDLTGDKIESARRLYVRLRQSFFSLGSSRKNKGWHMAKTQSNCAGGETVSKWNNAIPKLHDVAIELRKNIQITNYDFLECIDRIDFEGAFFYCDPPYPYETRASKDDYLFEFTTEQHEQLAKKLHSIKGLAMVSSYNSELYDGLYKDWTKVELPIKKNNIRSGDVQEVLWFNYPIEKTKKYHREIESLKSNQIDLFDAIEAEENKNFSYPSINTEGIIGLYTCSCHLFKTYEEATKAKLQKMDVGQKVKNRCSGNHGVVIEKAEGKGYVIVKYGPLPKDNHLEHVQELIKT